MHRFRIFLPLFIVVSLTTCTPVYYGSNTSDAGSQTKKLLFEDKTYEKEIRTVKLRPVGNVPYTKFPTPIIPLNGGTRLTLEFDDLAQDSDYYMLRLMYLTSDWKESYVNSIDYLSEYNEFRVTSYDLSLDTKVKYVHYSVDIPDVTIPGNYLAIIYREGNEDDIILSRRFVVFSGEANVTGPDNQTGFSNLGGHRIDFNVFYRDLQVEDPYNQIKAVVRQNGRWDNAARINNPTFVKEDQGKIEYKFFDNTNSFQPGNEYRFFDIRSVIAPGQFIKSIDRQSSPLRVWVQQDKPRTGLAYSFHRDLNGSFEVVNFDAGNSSYYSDYLNVNFELKTDPYDSAREVYVFGELTNWELTSEGKMKFNRSNSSYEATLLLKQGWYDYQYFQSSPGNDPNILEGNHINTENYYEILVYFLPIGSREEHCVGYFQFGINERLR